MFKFNFSEELNILIRKLSKRDRLRALILHKKIKEIVDSDDNTIDRYKNCKYDLKEYKRVHIDKSFVLLFKVNKQENRIYFWRVKHHDQIYE